MNCTHCGKQIVIEDEVDSFLYWESGKAEPTVLVLHTDCHWPWKESKYREVADCCFAPPETFPNIVSKLPPDGFASAGEVVAKPRLHPLLKLLNAESWEPTEEDLEANRKWLEENEGKPTLDEDSLRVKAADIANEYCDRVSPARRLRDEIMELVKEEVAKFLSEEE